MFTRIEENSFLTMRLCTSKAKHSLLEPYEGKLSRTVLRGEGPRKGADLLDLAVENNDELNGHLNLMEVPVKHSNCYFAPLDEDLAEQLED